MKGSLPACCRVAAAPLLMLLLAPRKCRVADLVQGGHPLSFPFSVFVTSFPRLLTWCREDTRFSFIDTEKLGALVGGDDDDDNYTDAGGDEGGGEGGGATAKKGGWVGAAVGGEWEGPGRACCCRCHTVHAS